MYDACMFPQSSSQTVARGAVWFFFGLHLIAQPIYALLPASLEVFGSLVIVCAFVLFSFLHLMVSRGLKTSLILLGVCLVVAGGSEVLSVHTGFPYGWYHYTPKLGFAILNVPVLVPFCWLMMAYPVSKVVALILPTRFLVLGSALALTAWDVFLDPQMVRTGYWVWHRSGEYVGIPLENYAGWFLTALIVFGLYQKIVPALPTVRTDWFGMLPVLVYIWTWLGSSVVNIFWWGQPLVGGAGFFAMGLFALPAVMYLFKRPVQERVRLHA